MTVPQPREELRPPSGSGLRLVLHHDYGTGSAEDRSGHGHDGTVVGGRFAGTSDGARGGIELDGARDRIVVRPTDSFARLVGLRVDVTVLLHDVGQRRNLVEGYLSFALSVFDDGSLHGGVYDRSGWLAVRSSVGRVTPGRWFDLTYTCAAELGSHLYIDGDLVGHDPRSPRAFGDTSWPFGLNMGGWPDADLFMLRGRLAAVRIWVDDGSLD